MILCSLLQITGKQFFINKIEPTVQTVIPILMPGFPVNLLEIDV